MYLCFFFFFFSLQLLFFFEIIVNLLTKESQTLQSFSKVIQGIIKFTWGTLFDCFECQTNVDCIFIFNLTNSVTIYMQQEITSIACVQNMETCPNIFKVH